MNKIISLTIYTLMALPLAIVGLLFVLSVIIFPSKMNVLGRITSITVLKLLFVDVKIVGKIPRNKSMILMFNHTSFIDPFLFAYFSPGKTTGITAVENYKLPVFGWMLKKWNAIPIDRSNMEKARQSIKMGEQALSDGYNVIILPEGTRTVTGKIGKFKKGGFHMAKNIKAPILPVGTRGAFEFKPKNRWFIKPRTVYLQIGTVVEPTEFDHIGIDGVIKNVRLQISKLTGYELEN